MKKLMFILILCVLTSPLFSQCYFDEDYFVDEDLYWCYGNMYNNSKEEKKEIREKGIKSTAKATYKLSSDGIEKKLKSRKETNYNKNGDIVFYSLFDRKDELTYNYDFKFEDTLISEFIKKYKDNIKDKEEIKWVNGKWVDYKYYKKNGELIKRRHTAKYNELGKISEQVYFKKGGEKISSTWKYFFYDDGKRSKTLYYNKKGDLKHKWSYACDSEGKEQENFKDTTEVCEFFEYNNDGSKIRIVRTTSKKGKIRKYKYVYDVNDNQTEIVSYNTKNKIIRRYTYKYDANKNVIDRVSYKNGGEKVKWHYIKEFDEDNNLIVSIRYCRGGKKIKRKTLNEFNQDNNKISSATYKKNGEELSYKNEYKYDSKGNQVESKKYTKGGKKLSRLYITEYSYY